jgi:hypothetical protein
MKILSKIAPLGTLTMVYLTLVFHFVSPHHQALFVIGYFIVSAFSAAYYVIMSKLAAVKLKEQSKPAFAWIPGFDPNKRYWPD